VCCIDELDKIDCDYHALLEALEQQSVSVAKSGVVTSLKSRCAVIAAANPAGGHYTRSKTVSKPMKE
jgi:DNA helicase MCM8